MNLSFHLLRKDFKYARFWILATWVVAAMALLLPVLPVEIRFDMAMSLVLFRYGSWLLLFLTVSHVVLLDAPARDSAFFRTLPISSATWLRSKLLFALLLVFPMALVQGLMIVALGLFPGFLDFILLVAEDFLSHAIAAGLAVAMAARKPNHAKFYASVAICLGVIIATAFILGSVQEQIRSGRKVEWSYSGQYLSQSRFLIIQILALIGIVAGLIAFSRNRRVRTLGMALVGTLAVSALALKFWPVNFVEMMAAPEAEAPRNEWPDVDQVKVEFTETEVGRRNKSMFSSQDSGYNDLTYRTINANSEVAGLPAKWYVFKNGYEAEIELSNGTKISSSDQARGRINEELLLSELGIPSWRDREQATERLPLNIAEFVLTDASGAAEDAKIRGEVKIPFVRPVILARIPLKAGETAKLGNNRFQIISASQIGDQISFNILQEYASLKLRGGVNSSSQRDISFMVINQEKRSYLDHSGSSSSGTTIGHYGAIRQDMDMEIWRDFAKDDRRKPDATGWLGGAELLIIGQENGGEITKKFDFSGISLSNPRGD